ncbi:MAG: hypothetical protein R3A10_09160 [Caldilineaceae bacterium]
MALLLRPRRRRPLHRRRGPGAAYGGPAAAAADEHGRRELRLERHGRALRCYPAIVECETDGYTLPVLEYGRSQGQSVVGGYVYRGPTYPRMAGAYFFGDFVNGRIWGLRRDGADWTSQLLLETDWNGRLVSFGEDEAGELYVVDLNGSLYRLGDTLQISDLPTRAFLPLIVERP